MKSLYFGKLNTKLAEKCLLDAVLSQRPKWTHFKAIYLRTCFWGESLGTRLVPRLSPCSSPLLVLNSVKVRLPNIQVNTFSPLTLYYKPPWGTLADVPYSRKLLREKTFANWWKYDFRGKNFHRLLTFAAPKDATPQNLQRKLLRIATKLNVTWWLVQYLQTVLLGCYWNVLPCQWEGDNIHQSLTTWIWLDAPYAVLVSRDHTCSR